jgi:predicted RNase H-like nuclease (RuvC/YqgF family)
VNQYWTQSAEKVQKESQWKTENIDTYIASLRQQLADSREINSHLRNELHKLQQQCKVRHAGFVHVLSLSKEITFLG